MAGLEIDSLPVKDTLESNVLLAPVDFDKRLPLMLTCEIVKSSELDRSASKEIAFPVMC